MITVSTWTQQKLLADNAFQCVGDLSSPKSLSDTDSDLINSLINVEFMSFCSSYGSILTFPSEQAGKPVQDVLTFDGFDGSSNYFSAKHPLSLHQDYYFQELPPQFTIIWCLRNDEKAKTVVVDLLSCFERLDEGSQVELMKPEFSIADYGDGMTWSLYPVIDILAGSFRYDEDLIEPLSASTSEAFQKLVHLARASEVELILEPNDVLVINNHRCAHGRRSYSPGQNDRRRWLKRCLVGVG